MSYDIYLKDPKTNEVYELSNPHHMKGGTYCIGGTDKATFNITYNYSKILCDILGEKGIRTIYGMSGYNSLPILSEAMSKLTDDPYEVEYWTQSEGNVRIALLSLIILAKQCLDGIWVGD